MYFITFLCILLVFACVIAVARCVATHGETVLAIQERRSFLGIRYWHTIHTSTDYQDIVYFYKCILVGHPDLLTKEI